MKLVDYALAGTCRQRLEGLRRSEGPGIAREVHPEVSSVLQFTGHGVANHHRGAVAVEIFLVVTGVGQRLPRCIDGPFLDVVHGLGHPRRDPVGQGIEIEPAHESAYFGVAPVGRLGIGIVVILGKPAVAGNLTDAVFPGADVFPERGQIVGVGHHGAEPDNGYGSTGSGCCHVRLLIAGYICLLRSTIGSVCKDFPGHLAQVVEFAREALVDTVDLDQLHKRSQKRTGQRP